MSAQPGEDEAPAPNAAPFMPWGRTLYRGYYPVHRGLVGRLGSLLLVLLGLGIVFKALRHRAWYAHHAAQGGTPHPPRPPHASWRHGPWPHTPWPHGPYPHASWGCDPETETDDAERPPSDEQVAKVKPEPDAS